MAAHAVAQETLFALRQKIAKIEGRQAERFAAPTDSTSGVPERLVLRRNGFVTENLLPTGIAPFDDALGGGLPLEALVEIHAAQTRNAGAATGLALAFCAFLLKQHARPVLWIGTADIFREVGVPYAAGLSGAYGIAPELLLFSQVAKLTDALWIAEEAARLTTLAAVIVELRGNPRQLDLTATRRLHRRAQDAGRPVFLIRHSAMAEPTAAPVRLVASPARAGLRHTLLGVLDGSIGPPAFNVAIAKSRHSMPVELTLEWNADERAFYQRHSQLHRTPDIGVVAALSADRADHAQKAGQIVAFRGAA